MSVDRWLLALWRLRSIGSFRRRLFVINKLLRSKMVGGPITSHHDRLRSRLSRNWIGIKPKKLISMTLNRFPLVRKLVCSLHGTSSYPPVKSWR